MYVHLLLLAIVGLEAGHCQSASVQPTYEPANLVTEPALPGTWRSGDETWIVDTAAGGGYRARLVTGSDDTTRYKLYLSRVDGMLLGDLEPRDDFGDYDLLPLHWYGVMHVGDSTMSYQSLDDDWLVHYLDVHPEELAHLHLSIGNVITAEPRAIQQFVRRHREEKDAWTPVVTTVRTRPEE